jgi:hypothetical protein
MHTYEDNASDNGNLLCIIRALDETLPLSRIWVVTNVVHVDDCVAHLLYPMLSIPENIANCGIKFGVDESLDNDAVLV